MCKMRVMLAATLAGVFLYPAVSWSADLQDVQIGSLYALTGPAAPSSIGDAASVRLAVKEIEDDGGFEVAGQKYKFVLDEEDTGSRAAGAISAAQKLISNGIKFIFGPTTTVDWVPAWGLMSKAEVMNLSFATGALPYLATPGGRYLFYPNRGLQAPIDASVDEAHKRWGFKTAAILIPGDAVGQIAGPYFKNALARNGVQVVYESTFAPTSREFSSQLTRIKTLQPDVLISGYFDDMMSTVMRQAVELEVAKKFIGMRGVTEASGQPLGKSIDGLAFPLVARDPSDPDLKGFVASFEKHFGKKPDRQMASGVYMHDAVWMLASAMKAAGTTSDLAKISAALDELKEYPHSVVGLKFKADRKADHTQVVGILDGATGRVTFDKWTD